MLTREQKEEFQERGVVVLRGFFADEAVGWRREAQAFYDYPAIPWEEGIRRHRHTDFRLRDEPLPSRHGRMSALLRGLNPGLEWTGEHELIVRAPEPEGRWLGPRAPHIDFPVGKPIRLLANTVVLLSDVRPRGGAFMYWPGSHHAAWSHFRDHPLDYMARGDYGQDAVFARVLERVRDEVVEFTGEAGDLLLWHHLLVHSPSVNLRDEARIALFARWGLARPFDEEPFDFAGPMWQFWDFG